MRIKLTNGFTLIELLIVVAIIGILAAVGSAVIPGLLEKAKINAVKANYNTIFKYVQAEVMKCEIGGEIEAHELFPTRYRGCDQPGSIRNFEQISGTVIAMLHSENQHIQKIGNPFNKNDKFVIGNSHSCPSASVAHGLGDVNCGYNSNTDKVHCCARWGMGPDDTISGSFGNLYD